MHSCLKLSSFLKASDGKGGQSEGVIDLAGVAGLCSGLCFSFRAVAALGLPLKVQENTEVSSLCVCVCVCGREYLGVCMCHHSRTKSAGHLDEFVSFVVDAHG